jgi:hypothetical protein
MLRIFAFQLAHAELHAIGAGAGFGAARESIAGGRELKVDLGHSCRKAGVVPDVRVMD